MKYSATHYIVYKSSRSFFPPRIIFILSLFLLISLCSIAFCDSPSELQNIAKGCPVTFDSPPNYALCTDDNDASQLTDGQYCPADSPIWMDKGCVGWRYPLVFITIDLGKVQPISGFSFITVAGIARVCWPLSILVFVSDDNKEWFFVSDLASLKKNQTPPIGKYSTFKYKEYDLSTHGRYLRIGISVSGFFLFTDEVEIYKGSDSLLNLNPAGNAIKDTSAYIQDTQVLRNVIARIADDITYVRKELEKSAISGEKKTNLSSC